MMLDEDIVAVSPATTYRLLKREGLLDRWNGTPSKKGTGFVQPLQPHEHWHVDISYINLAGTFYYLCSILRRRNDHSAEYAAVALEPFGLEHRSAACSHLRTPVRTGSPISAGTASDRKMGPRAKRAQNPAPVPRDLQNTRGLDH